MGPAHARASMALYFARRAAQGVCRHAIVADFNLAIRYMVDALSCAAREGYPPAERAPLFRMLNWLRADLRKARAA